MPGIEDERAWWKEAVIYQIYPRSFADSDGDGVGDLQGIIDRLDHVASLGVDVVWLNPVYESPQVDNGYDISDYRSIHEEYGTMADWEELLAEIHDRDMRLVMDLVVNHTSADHEWFQQSRQGDPEYEDYYIWREGEEGGPPNNWESFFGGSAWEYDEERGEYYLHLYDRSQPDLNWANPDVRRDIHDMIEWWLEKGIDGFRMDVVNLLSKADGLPDGDLESEWVGSEHFIDGPEMYDYLEALDEQVLSDYDILTVGEMPQLDVGMAQKYAGEDGPLDMAFHFQHTKLDYDEGERWGVGEWDLSELRSIMRRWQTEHDGWNALYWENHDQPRVVSRYGDPERYHRESATLLGTFLLTHAGTPYIYQGQELGMTNASWESVDQLRDVDAINQTQALLDADTPTDAPDAEAVADATEADGPADVSDAVGYRSRDNARTPMQWDDAENAGFTEGEPWIQVNRNYTDINVAAQQESQSVLEHYRTLVDLRNQYDALVYGDYEDYEVEGETVYAFTRAMEHENGREELFAALNFGEAPATIDLPAEDSTLVLSNYDRDDSDDAAPLEPYEARLYDLT